VRARDLGRLLRVSLAPSAAADAAAGLLVGGRGRLPEDGSHWLLLPAALGVYTGALALNDWADRAHDAATRPERPLPSGAVPAGAALALGLALVAGGVALAFAAGPAGGWILGAVAVLAVAYDLAARGPLVGPLLLALCRAGNLTAGIALAASAAAGSIGSPGVEAGPLVLAALYGLYVFLASRLGRMEDGVEALSAARARRLIGASALVLATLPLWTSLPLPGLPNGASDVGTSAGAGLDRWPVEAPLALLAAAGLLPLVRRRQWSLSDVQKAMGALLRRLLAFTAVLALSAARFPEADVRAAVLVALAILAGYPLAHRLRRWFPPS
jgi:4-hydroxybenzoate polyprenyltransferase